VWKRFSRRQALGVDERLESINQRLGNMLSEIATLSVASRSSHDAKLNAARRSLQRSRRTLFLCLVAMIAAILCGWIAQPAFVDPGPNRTVPGTAVVAVQSGSGASSDVDVSFVTITTYVEQSDHPQLTYQLRFKPSLQDHEFVFMLTGSAVLATVTASTEVVTEYRRCVRSPDEKPAVGAPICQLIGGRIPQKVSETTAYGPCGDVSASEGSILVTLQGPAQTDSKPDRFHHITSLPDLSSPSQAGQTITQWSGIPLSFPEVVLATVACQYVQLNPDWMNNETSSEPKVNTPSTMGWTPQSPFEVIAIVSRQRSAVAIGTLLIALAGALAALSLAFLPSALDARWKYHNEKVS